MTQVITQGAIDTAKAVVKAESETMEIRANMSQRNAVNGMGPKAGRP